MSNPIDDFESGRRTTFYQREHERINSVHYPGTRQLCVRCNSETDRCEEDALYAVNGVDILEDDPMGPLCECCYNSVMLPPLA